MGRRLCTARRQAGHSSRPALLLPRRPHRRQPSRAFSSALPFAKIYEETGIQFMAINTIYHLEAQQAGRSAPSLANADHFLTMADYFNARFCGIEVVEESLASTTQMYNPQTHAAGRKSSIATLGLEELALSENRPERDRRSAQSPARLKNCLPSRKPRSSPPARTIPATPSLLCLPITATTGRILVPALGRCSARNCPNPTSPPAALRGWLYQRSRHRRHDPLP